MLSCFRAIASSGPVDNDDARATFERVIQEIAPGGVLRTPPILGARLYLAAAYAGLGDKSNAHEQARRGVADYENDALLKPIAEAFRAKALAQLGEVDAAIDALPHLLEVPGGIHPGDLRFSPYWDPLAQGPALSSTAKEPAAGSVLKRRGSRNGGLSSRRLRNGGRETAASFPQKNQRWLKVALQSREIEVSRNTQ